MGDVYVELLCRVRGSMVLGSLTFVTFFNSFFQRFFIIKTLAKIQEETV